MAPIKVVLIGMGRMGRHHFRILQEDPRFELLAVVDPVLVELPAGAPPLLRDIEAVSKLAFQLAVIAAPTELHVPLVRQMLEGGRHVFVEKPAAATAADAAALVALAQRRGLTLTVGNIERCNPVVARLREVLASGMLGRIVHVNGLRAGGYPANVRSGNDVILDLGIHELDVCRMLLGPLRIVQSIGHATRQPGIIDTAEITVANAEGSTGTVHVNWLSPERLRSIRVTGTTGVAHVDYIAQTLSFNGFELSAHAAGRGLSWERSADGLERAAVPLLKQETLKLQLDELYRCLRGEPHHLAAGAELVASVALIEEALAGALKFAAPGAQAAPERFV